MKKTTLFFLLASLSLLLSCKKKTSTSSTASTAATNTTTPGLYSGLFIAERFITWYNGAPFLQPAYLPLVVIPATPQSANAIVAFGTNAGIVKSNNVQLQFNNAIKMYTDSTGTLSYSAQISFQHNSTALGTINFMNTDTFPAYPKSLALSIKDTIDRSKNYVIPLNNLSYYDEASVTISGTNASISPLFKSVSPGVSGITFSPSDLSALPPGNNYLLRVILKKFNDQTINGKLFRFENDGYNQFTVVLK